MLLSNRTQAQIIADLLRGASPDFDPRDLTGKYHEYHRWLQQMSDVQTPEGLYHHFLVTFSRGEEYFADCKFIGELRDVPLEYPPIEEMRKSLPDLRWLWHKWIARAQLTILVGDPSAGKSYVALNLAQRIAVGGEFPDGTSIERPGNTIYIDAENRPSIFKDRIQLWSTRERERLYYMLPTPHRLMINFDDVFDRERLLDRAYRIRPELIIVDSYNNISLKGINAKEDVQRNLSFLRLVGRDYDCAILIIHHQRKPSRMQLTLPSMPELNIHNILGSGFFGQTATNILGIKRVTANKNGVRSLHIIKSNIGQYPEPIGITFSPWDENPDVAILSFGDVPEPQREPTKLEQCTVWLLELLAEEGALAPADVIELAEEEGFSRRTIYRARKQLAADVVDTQSRHHPKNRWSLPQDEAS